MDISHLKIFSGENENSFSGHPLFDDGEWEQFASEVDDWRKTTLEEEVTRQAARLKSLLAQWVRETEPTLVFGRFLDLLGLGDEKGNIVIPAM